MTLIIINEINWLCIKLSFRCGQQQRISFELIVFFFFLHTIFIPIELYFNM